ncbi:MAG: TonB-dependent receptor [Cyclobacteriaceae bacterium]
MKNKLLQLVVMFGKISVYFLVLGALLLNTLMANEGNAQRVQSVKEATITLELADASLEQAFRAIEKNSDFVFVFNKKTLNDLVKLDLSAEDRTVESILLEISEKAEVGFRQVNNNISVRNHRTKQIEVIIQQAEVSGQVTDESGEGLPGATVLVKGTTNGTVTDIDGNFRLSITDPDNAVLAVSFVGYTSQDVSVAGQTLINVSLQPDFTSLAEVVVIGYGSVEKRDLTGAVSSVKSEEIKMAPVISPVEAIQGRVAGLDITRSDGRAGSGVNILLRGNRTLGDDNSSEPIYIVDGIQGSINNLNPNDIASIDVLKDASSTAIYGASGANGVIIITTKKPQTGTMQVDFDSYVSINDNPSYPSPLKGQAWLDYLDEGYRAFNGEDGSREEVLTAWGLNPVTITPYIDDNRYVDWVDETFQRGVQTNNTLSIRGGNNRVQGGFSAGHNKTEGVYRNDNINVYTMRANMDVTTSDWAKFGLVTGLIYRDRNETRSRINKAYGLAPVGDAVDENGNINQFPVDDETGIVSPLANNIPGTYLNNRKSFNWTANPYAKFSLIKGLDLTTRAGVSLNSGRRGVYKSDHTYLMLTGSEAAIRSAEYETELDYSYIWENILNYKVTLANSHELGATFITAYSHSQSESSYAGNGAFNFDYQQYYDLGAGFSPVVSSEYEMRKRSSYAGRVNYSFQSKYLFTASVRFDGWSQLAEGNEWDVFPAAAFAWRISDEGFLSDVDVVDELKLRVGYGVVGSANIKPYSSLSGVQAGPQKLDLGGGQVATYVPGDRVANGSLGWEKSYNLNLGLDFGIFNNRIFGSLEWYNTDTKDIIFDKDLPSSVGGTGAKDPYTRAGNIAEMNNHGVELTLNSSNIRRKDFKWNTTLTFARNWEEVVSVELGAVEVDNLVDLGLFFGRPRDVYYEYKKIGIWQLGEEEDAAVFGSEPGDVKVASSLTKKSDGVWSRMEEDEEGNMVEVEYTSENPYSINPDDDRRIIGQGAPKWTAGLQNSLSYKGFDLNVFVTGRWGQMIDGQLLGYFDYGDHNIPDVYDYWTPTNASNDYPRPNVNRSSNTLESLRYVNGSFLKVKNITLGYTIPDNVVENIGLSNIRVYSTIYNALIITKSDLLKGMDPENNASDSWPLYKQVVFGVNVSF